MSKCNPILNEGYQMILKGNDYAEVAAKKPENYSHL